MIEVFDSVPGLPLEVVFAVFVSAEETLGLFQAGRREAPYGGNRLINAFVERTQITA